jgi:Asp/Glu/hydantoin racemase
VDCKEIWCGENAAAGLGDLEAAIVKRIAFLHTVAALAEKFRSLTSAELPNINAFHMLDESLLQDLMRQQPVEGITRRLVTFVGLAVEAGAELVVFTCSSTSPLVDVARRCHQIPILKIDDPMAERAVLAGERIGLLCTTSSTVAPSSDLIAEHAARLGRPVAVEAVLVDNAFAALQRGDRTVHDELVQAAAADIAPRTDVIVLAQASMAHLAEPLGSRLSVPVLSSPPILMEALRDRLLRA